MKTQEQALQILAQYYGQMPRDDYDFLDEYIRNSAMAKALMEAEYALKMLMEKNERDSSSKWGMRTVPSNEACDKAEHALSQIQALNGGGDDKQR